MDKKSYQSTDHMNQSGGGNASTGGNARPQQVRTSSGLAQTDNGTGAGTQTSHKVK